MPPIKSSLPGARVTKTSSPPSKRAVVERDSPASRRLTMRTKSSVSASPCVEPHSGIARVPFAQQPASFERRAQQRLYLFSYRSVGVADPRHVRLDRERRAQRSAVD